MMLSINSNNQKLLKISTLGLKCIVMLLFCTLLNVQLYSQKRDEDCEICKVALAKDIISTNSSYQSRLYQLDIIDEKMFEQMGRSVDWNSIIPIWSFNGSYSDFSEKRREYFKLMNFRSDQSNSYQQLKIYSSDRAYNSYDKCIEQCFQSKSKDNLATIVLYKIKDNASSVIIRLRYIGNDFAYPNTKVTLKCRVGKFLITNEIEKTVDINKNSFKDFEFSRYDNTVNIEAYINNNLYDQIISKYERPEESKQFNVTAYFGKSYTDDVRLEDFWIEKKTWEMHEVPSDNCNCEVCNPNRGQWCHGDYTLRYPENYGGSESHYLRNCSTCYFGEVVKKECGPDQGACNWNAGVFAETFRIEKYGSGRDFKITFTAGSHSCTYRIFISVYKRLTKYQENSADVKNYGRIVTVTVPNNANQPYIVINRNGIGKTIYLSSFGSRDFLIEDLRFNFIGSFYESGKTIYQYRVF